MARIKIEILLILVALSISTGYALDFQVQVSPEPEANVFQPNITFDGDLVKARATVDNSGSVGCEFRIKGEIVQGGQIIDRYSSPYRIWQGDIQTLKFYYVPMNYSGRVTANLTLDYCGQNQDIETRKINVSKITLPNETLSSRTLELRKRKSLISLGSPEDILLVPQKYPPYWKVGSVKIENGKGWIEYDPTLFRKGEEILYTVVRNQTVMGKTTVILEDQESWYEELLRKVSNWFRTV